jgi:hypothetical protein
LWTVCVGFGIYVRRLQPIFKLGGVVDQTLVPIDLIPRYVKSAPVFFSHEIADLKSISFIASSSLHIKIEFQYFDLQICLHLNFIMPQKSKTLHGSMLILLMRRCFANIARNT